MLKRLKRFKRKVQSEGMGLTGFFIRKLVSSYKAKRCTPAGSILGTEPLFRYATCNDLIQLMAQYPDYCRHDRHATTGVVWGLKNVGTLFCADKIIRLDARRVLEVGAGWNCHFDKHFGERLDYWMVDDFSDIGNCAESEKRFQESKQKRQHTHFVRGLLGSNSTELPDNAFDLVFSISVIEHVPPQHKAGFYKDMFRVTKPGGYIAHAIDVPTIAKGRAEFNYIEDAGFILPKVYDLEIRIRPDDGDPTLFEDLGSVFNSYFGMDRPDKWDKIQVVRCHYPTILVLGRKPV